MSDVFISYSRLDDSFAGQLREAMVAQQQTVWIDWASIPASQAWWEEIKRGIEGSNNFVVILSPNSMASPMCQMEIEYARQLKKRIIPVLYQKYEREASIVAITKRLAKPEEKVTREIWGSRQIYDVFDANDTRLQEINYFPFHEEQVRGDFAGRFGKLLDVVQTDFLHTEQHTTLQLRAQEWVRRNRDSGFLLVETELLNAEAWLEKATGKNPEPTDLHREYIESSRKAEDERRRRLQALQQARRRARQTLIGVAVGSGILIAVAIIFANLQLSNASNQVNQAATQVAGVQPTVAVADTRVSSAATEVGAANAQATQIQSTLSVAEAQIAEAQGTLVVLSDQVSLAENRILSQRLAAQAQNILNLPDGDAETAALLSIRALNASYTEQADAALIAASPRLYTRWNLPQRRSADVGYSPDGRLIVTGGYDGAVRVWDVDTLEETQTFDRLQISEPALSVEFSPDGRFIVAAYRDGMIRIWNVETGEEVRTLEGHEYDVYRAVYSPDGQFIASTSQDSTVRVWNANTGEMIRILSDHSTIARSVRYSPDGRFIASPSDNLTIQIWDAATGEVVKTLAGHPHEVQDIAFSPDGQFIAGATGYTFGETFDAYIWNIDTGEIVHALTGHTDIVSSIDYSPDGQFVVTGSEDQTVRVWDAETGEQVSLLTGHTDRVVRANYSPDGRYIISTAPDDTVRIWDTPTSDRQAVLLANLQEATRLAYRPDGRFIAAAYDDNIIRVWDTSTGESAFELTGHTSSITSVTYSPDGRLIVSTSYDGNGSARIWDAERGIQIQMLTGHESGTVSAAFSPDQRSIVVVDGVSHLHVWDTGTWRELRSWFPITMFMSEAVYSPDGQYIVSMSPGNIQVSEAATGDPTAFRSSQFFDSARPAQSAAFSPDGRFIVQAYDDNTVRSQEVENFISEIIRMTGHTGFVTDVAYSPDGQTIVSASEDTTLRLWDASDGSLVRVLSGHTAAVRRVVYSPDGQFILSLSDDDTVRMWYADLDDAIASVCARLFRDFSDEERIRFNIEGEQPTCGS